MKRLILLAIMGISLNASCIAENELARETGMKAIGLLKHGVDGCGYAKLSKIHSINGVTMCENDKQYSELIPMLKINIDMMDTVLRECYKRGY
jgi:hypothetical protein